MASMASANAMRSNGVNSAIHMTCEYPSTGEAQRRDRQFRRPPQVLVEVGRHLGLGFAVQHEPR